MAHTKRNHIFISPLAMIIVNLQCILRNTNGIIKGKDGKRTILGSHEQWHHADTEPNLRHRACEATDAG